MDICLSRHQHQHKILRVFDTHNDIFQEIFWVIIALFAISKCKCEKKLYIFKHFAKSKKLIFCQNLSISL
jgi:hypothetical protein